MNVVKEFFLIIYIGAKSGKCTHTLLSLFYDMDNQLIATEMSELTFSELQPSISPPLSPTRRVPVHSRSGRMAWYTLVLDSYWSSFVATPWTTIQSTHQSSSWLGGRRPVPVDRVLMPQPRWRHYHMKLDLASFTLCKKWEMHTLYYHYFTTWIIS